MTAQPEITQREVRRNEEQSDYDEHAERARRLDILQRAENEFDPIPFDADAARLYGRVCAAVISAGRKPRRRVAALMIAAIAIAEELPLFTTNPDDYKGLDGLLTVVPVTRPTVLARPVARARRAANVMPPGRRGVRGGQAGRPSVSRRRRPRGPASSARRPAPCRRASGRSW